MDFQKKAGYTQRRRAVTAMLIVVSLPVLIGTAALTVDVGLLYNARADMQTAADAGAHAAGVFLSTFENAGESSDPLSLARDRAAQLVASNRVLGQTMELSASDVQFGTASFDDSTGTYRFVPTEILPNAIRVTVRHTADSPNGKLPLLFAGIFGVTQTELTASATAMLAPRDIAVVADMSASHNDDSELRNYRLTNINMYDLWEALPGGVDDAGNGLWDLSEIPESWILPNGSIPQAEGPGWGFFRKLGFGDETLDASYNPDNDPGLIKLAFATNWSDTTLRNALFDQGYITSEVNAIMSGQYDFNGAYGERVAVALGLAIWNSGHDGGLWTTRGVDPSQTGNGNNWVGGSELEWNESVFDYSLDQSAGIWLDYIDNYAASTYTRMYNANSKFRYQYGIKTFVNYLLETRPEFQSTPEFASVPQQPMQAVKDSIKELTRFLTLAGGNDRLSLEVYGTTARHEVDLTENYDLVSTRLLEMQAGHYDRNTNMGGGILRGIEELESTRARSFSRKAIVVLTDGRANIDGGGQFSYPAGRSYALDMAREAANRGIKIFTVSVGANADTDLMAEIAEIGSGLHFHAEGSIEEYSANLQQILITIGGAKSVELIQ